MKRELTYLIQFKILTQTRKLQLSECLATMFSTSIETSCSNGSYFRCEKDYSEWNLCRQRINLHAKVTKMNKLKGITEITLNLDELNNSVNLKDGRPSNELLTYHVTDDKDFMRFEPQSPQYKNLKTESLLP